MIERMVGLGRIDLLVNNAGSVEDCNITPFMSDNIPHSVELEQLKAVREAFLKLVA